MHDIVSVQICDIIHNIKDGESMKLKLIAKVEESPVFEVDRGMYIIVKLDGDRTENRDLSRCEVTPCWTNPLGRFAWYCSKCGSDPSEDECIKLIEKNKDYILESLNKLSEVYKEYPELQKENAECCEETLNSMKEGETVSWD